MYRLCNFAISVSADTTHHTTYTAEVLRQGCVRYRTGEAVRQARLRACVECVACILIDISISKCKRVPSELSDCEGKFERAPARARYYPSARPQTPLNSSLSHITHPQSSVVRRARGRPHQSARSSVARTGESQPPADLRRTRGQSAALLPAPPSLDTAGSL